MWQNAVFARCRNDCADESVATAIECGQMAAGISVVIPATVNVIDTPLNGKLTSISTQLK